MCHPTLPFSGRLAVERHACPAKALSGNERQEVAVQALAKAQSITRLAQERKVSRKFVYQQAATAAQALEQAFDSPTVASPTVADDAVLFYLPVTKSWLRQLALSALLTCHSSYRAVRQLFRDVLDCPLSMGTVHNIAQDAVRKARLHNQRYSLASIRIGAHDEIYQAGQPVLVGADTWSTYCYLLSPEEGLDGDTWAIRLWELQQRGFAPKATVADGGRCLRAGQKLALPEVLCRGDVFHVLRDLQQLVGFLEQRAYDALAACERCERKLARANHRGQPTRSLGQRARQARVATSAAIAVADDVGLLYRWLRDDVLAVAGPCAADRRELYDFLLAELSRHSAQAPHRLGPLCQLLQNYRDELLAFAEQLDEDIDALAEEFQVAPSLIRELLTVQTMNQRSSRRWAKDALLRQRLGSRYHDLCQAVDQLRRHTVRASSIVENLNSRLRNYFFLRRQLGQDYLCLLQFYLNHHCFERSDCPHRVGKSPAELLSGQAHPHWLEMLGYRRFSRN